MRVARREKIGVRMGERPAFGNDLRREHPEPDEAQARSSPVAMEEVTEAADQTQPAESEPVVKVEEVEEVDEIEDKEEKH